MYQPGPGGPGEQHPQQHGFYPPPNSHLAAVPGLNQKMQPASKSGHLPPPHMYGVPPSGPPPPGPPPPGPQPPGPQPPGPMPFVAPGPPHSSTYIPPQQPYAQPYNPAAAAAAYPPPPHHPPQHAMHFIPQQPDPAAGPAPAAGAYPGFGMPLNPLNIMAAGSLLSGGGGHWGQQYVERMQQRVGYFTGGALHFHFAINNQYVYQKLLMLLAPFLKRWTYTRIPEQMQGGPAFKPPREDVNCPDLYLPLMALWSYVLLVCGLRAAGGAFKPDGVYPLVWSAVVAWLLHLLFARALLRAMALPSSIPWLELAAYTGYPLVPVCVSLAAGGLGGRGAYWAAWAYGSLCSAVFLVRTMKRVVFQETRGYGRDLTLVNYLLLALALFQFPYALYLGIGVHP